MPQSRPGFSSAGICYRFVRTRICKTAFFIHFSMAQDGPVHSVPLNEVTLWWLSNGISGTVHEKFLWRPTLPARRPGKARRGPACALRKLQGAGCGPVTSEMTSFPLGTCERAWIWVAF